MKRFGGHNVQENYGFNMGTTTQNSFTKRLPKERLENWVDMIMDEHGERFKEDEDIAQVFTNYFMDLFKSSEPDQIEEVVSVVQGRVSPIMRDSLHREFTQEEVFNALKSMKPIAAPSPDGMPAIFFQKFWNIVGVEVTNGVMEILNNGRNPTNLNHTFICLIPKIKKPIMTGDFRPISLCNVIFKIVTKTITNHLKLILPNIVDKYQSAFVLGRLITDNALISFEAFHYMRQKRKEWFCGTQIGHV